MNDDPWAALAAEQISGPVKARMRAVKTRTERREAKKKTDDEILARGWRDWHDKQLAKLNSGRYRQAVRIVATFLERMTLEDGDALIALIERGPWHDADADTRYWLLGLIASRIIFLRQAENWPPFSDSIPFIDEAPTVFEIIRTKLQRENQ
jgi:hypothetical protein